MGAVLCVYEDKRTEHATLWKQLCVYTPADNIAMSLCQLLVAVEGRIKSSIAHA